MAKGKPKKAKRPGIAQEHGSPWLQQHTPVVVDETMAAGVTRARVEVECLLDALKLNGRLGEGDDAGRRHEAGTWFRRLYARCQLTTSVTMLYDVFGRDCGELSERDAEALAWNRKCLRETMLGLGRHAILVRDVCAFDRHPGSAADLRDGLDRLAKMRGIE